jgi:hypothetical protein
MKRMNLMEKIDALTNFLNNISTNKSLFIQCSDARLGQKFAIGEKLANGCVNIKSNFMTYEEMNCYFFGVLAVQESRIEFKPSHS